MWYATERIKRKKWGDKSIPLKCWVTAHSGLCWESTVLFSLTIEIQVNAQWKHPAAAARASSRKLSVLQRCRLAPDTGRAERPTGCKGGGGRWRGSYSYSPGLNQAFTTCLKITERARRREERDRVCAHIHRGECAEWRKVARLLNENLCVCVCVCVCVVQWSRGPKKGLSTLRPRIHPSAGKREFLRPAWRWWLPSRARSPSWTRGRSEEPSRRWTWWDRGPERRPAGPLEPKQSQTWEFVIEFNWKLSSKLTENESGTTIIFHYRLFWWLTDSSFSL